MFSPLSSIRDFQSERYRFQVFKHRQGNEIMCLKRTRLKAFTYPGMSMWDRTLGVSSNGNSNFGLSMPSDNSEFFVVNKFRFRC